MLWAALLVNAAMADNEPEIIKQKIDKEENYKLKVDLINKYLNKIADEGLNFDKAYYEKGVSLASYYNYQPGLADLNLNYVLNNKGTLPYDSLKNKLESSITIFKNFSLKNELATTHYTYADLNYNNNKITDAANEYYEAYKLFDEENDTNGLIKTYIGFAKVYCKTMMYLEADFFIKLALQITNTSTPKYLLKNIYSCVGDIAFYSGKYHDALYNYQLSYANNNQTFNLNKGITFFELNNTDSSSYYLSKCTTFNNTENAVAKYYFYLINKKKFNHSEADNYKLHALALLKVFKPELKILNQLINSIYKSGFEVEPEILKLHVLKTQEYFNFISGSDYSKLATIYNEFLTSKRKSLVSETGIKSKVIITLIFVLTVIFSVAALIILNSSKNKIIAELKKQTDLQNKIIEVKNIEVMQAKENAEAAVNIKSQFISNINHEIRTPLNAIMGVANLLKQQNPTEQQLENINILKESSDKLLATINSMLDFGKMLHGNMQFQETPFNLKLLVKDIKDLFRLNAIEKGIEFELYIDETIPDKLIGDPLRINQVIINLVSNGIKFTQKGKVSLRVTRELSTLNNVLIHFEVKDTGIGINEKNQHAIFNSFVMAEADLNRKSTGVGLGLSISQKIIEALGSRINLQSQENVGSIFSFSLNFEIAKPELSPREKELLEYDNILKGNKVLIVEDNVMNILVLKQFLQNWGLKTEIAINGLDAIRRVKAETFDLILMDVHMPEMDGIEATKHIKESDNETIKNIPVIALTADNNDKVRDKLMKAGMADLILKPFDPDDLKERMAKVILISKVQIT
ncbi:MAG: response regulator [Bacteroidia bacterium]